MGFRGGSSSSKSENHFVNSKNSNSVRHTFGICIRSKKEGNLRCKAHSAWRLAKTNIAMPSAPCAMLKNQLI